MYDRARGDGPGMLRGPRARVARPALFGTRSGWVGCGQLLTLPGIYSLYTGLNAECRIESYRSPFVRCQCRKKKTDLDACSDLGVRLNPGSWKPGLRTPQLSIRVLVMMRYWQSSRTVQGYLRQKHTVLSYVIQNTALRLERKHFLKHITCPRHPEPGWRRPSRSGG